MTTSEVQAPRYIDSDGHILEHPTGMLDFAPAQYRDRIWHVETDAEGEWIVYNGRRTPANGLAGTAGFSDEDVDRVRAGEITYTQTRPSGWTADLRLKDLDTDGIELSVLYPTFMLGLQSVKDVDFGRAQARAYNDWCSAHLAEGQGRLFGAGALPPMHEASDVDAVAEELYRVAGLPGMVSVFMRPNPAVDWRYFNDPVYDRIWAAAQDTGLPIAFHPFLAPDLPGACDGLKLARDRGADGAYVSLEELEAAKTASGGNYISNIYFTQAIANPVDVMSVICYVTAGGVAERFPGAKFIMLEANGGWLVPWLERLDHHARKFSWDVPWLKMLPSEYFRRQCWISFDPDEAMLRVTAESPLVGADRIIWASDYPHPDAKFPGVTEDLTQALEGLTPQQQRAITCDSALELYGIG
ncbi:MAG TPA: amidohydrolase family protein [Acidimicrobiales bacterium]|nr:amidohydrolase family protein [Acidimicrobiales bacterium]